MKFWSVISLLIFLNFTALPCIAEMVGFELPQTNLVIQEEENHQSSLVIYEKTIPKTLDVHDFVNFFESKIYKNTYPESKHPVYLNPHLSIFSPPPEA